MKYKKCVNYNELMISKILRITLETFNPEVLNVSHNKLRTILDKIEVPNIRTVSLPTRRRIYCVLRSPHVNKDSREHFEIRIYKRLLYVNYIEEIHGNVCDMLGKTNLLPGISCKFFMVK